MAPGNDVSLPRGFAPEEVLLGRRRAKASALTWFSDCSSLPLGIFNPEGERYGVSRPEICSRVSSIARRSKV